MTTVNISVTQGSDENTRTRLTREITALISEILGNPADQVHVTLEENSAEGAGPSPADPTGSHDAGRVPGRPEYAWISSIECPPEAYLRYSDFRVNEINVELARVPGYVDSMLFRSREDPGRFVGITRWLSESLNSKYRSGSVHAELRSRSISFTGKGNRGAAYDIMH